MGVAIAALLVALPALAAQPQDAWITTQVKMKLLTAEDIDPFDINVDTFEGGVTLHGRVESSDRKQKAEMLAAEVDGVTSVRNLLAVVPEGAEEHVQATDEDIRTRVENVLGRDKALENSDIEVVSVNDGIVVLGGKAETLTAHRRALEDARSVDGVRSVASEIRSPNELADRELWSDVEPTDSDAANAASDMWITTKAKVKLMTRPGISPLAVNVDTRNGVVTLFGTVGTEDEKAGAEVEVAQIEGVRSVENELQVVPDVAADRVEAQDEQVLGAVRKRLEERASLKSADIDVEVSNGVVRLTGTVASFGDKMTALTVARTTEGVDSIVDGLRVETRKEG